MYCTKQNFFSKKDLRAGALGLFANFRFFYSLSLILN